MDNKTDATTQAVIATEFQDTNLIIVAHRLQTIVGADKMLGLYTGRLVEIDSPQALLQREGTFKALIDGSGDREALYEMAKRAVQA